MHERGVDVHVVNDLRPHFESFGEDGDVAREDGGEQDGVDQAAAVGERPLFDSHVGRVGRDAGRVSVATGCKS